MQTWWVVFSLENKNVTFFAKRVCLPPQFWGMMGDVTTFGPRSPNILSCLANESSWGFFHPSPNFSESSYRNLPIAELTDSSQDVALCCTYSWCFFSSFCDRILIASEFHSSRWKQSSTHAPSLAVSPGATVRPQKSNEIQRETNRWNRVHSSKNMSWIPLCFWCVFDVFLMCFWCVFPLKLWNFSLDH